MANALVRLASADDVFDPQTGELLKTLDFNETNPDSQNTDLSNALAAKASARRIGLGSANLGDYLRTAARVPGAIANSLVQMAVSGFTAPHDAMIGKLPVTQPDMGSGSTPDEAILRSLDLSGLMASGTLGGVPEGAIGSGAVRPKTIETNPFESWFKGSKVVDENSQPLVMYHGSTYEPDFTGTFGVHFGTKEAANDRLSEISRKQRQYGMEAGTPNITPVHLSIKNPAELPDAGAWNNSYNVAQAMLTKKPKGINRANLQEIMDEAEQLQEQHMYSEYEDSFDLNKASPETSPWVESPDNQRLLEELRRELEFAGYDGVKYKNMVEGKSGFGQEPEHSYIAFEPTQVKSLANRGSFDPNNPNILYAGGKGSAPVAGLIATADQGFARPFYSALDRAVESSPLTKAPAEQWAGTLQNMPGIKGEEYDWRGLGQYLDANKGKVLTKDDVLKHLEQNKVEVKEVNLGGRPINDETIMEEAGNLWLKDNPGKTDADLEGAFNRGELDRYMEEADYQMRGGPGNDPIGPKFSEYQLPGGENYREMLFTLPYKERFVPNTETPTTEGWTAKPSTLGGGAGGEQRWEVTRPGGAIIVMRGASPEDAIQKAANYYYNEFKPSVNVAEHENFNGPHWDEPNVLAHVRMNDREIPTGEAPTPAVEGFSVYNRVSGNKSPLFKTRDEAQAYYDKLPSSIQQSAHIIGDSTPAGKTPTARTLFMEEAQSDWHQKGRKEGYQNQGYKVYNKNDEPIAGPFATVQEAEDYARKTGDPFVTWDNKNTTQGVPDAPFKKTWPDMVLRRMVREAAEKGYDQIAWTDGATQAERYDLSKYIDELRYMKNQDGTFNVVPFKNDSAMHVSEKANVPQAELSNMVGKELADKIIKGEGELQRGTPEVRVLSGLDLKVGGEGMKAFYDQELPRRASKLFGKLGGKVEDQNMPGDGDVGPAYHIVGSDRAGHGYRITNMAGENVANGRIFETKAEAEKFYENLKRGPRVHVLRITPQMREEALTRGFPLFSSGAILPEPTTTDDGKYRLIPVSHDPFNT